MYFVIGSQHCCIWMSNQLDYVLSEAKSEQLKLLVQKKGQLVLSSLVGHRLLMSQEKYKQV